jgi:hypothetical protein
MDNSLSKIKIMPPSFLKHILLISQFELKRLFLTHKGLLCLLTFAVVWFLILYYPIRLSANVLVQSQRSIDVSRFFEFFGFDSLLSWGIAEFGVYWHFALVIFPTLTIIIAADQTCSDRQRGTLRFLALRTTRNRLFFGRLSGMLLIQTLLMLATLLSTLALVVYRDINLLSSGFNSVLAIMTNLFVVILPFTAMMAALSAALKSSRQTTVWAVLILSFMSGVISIFSRHLSFLGYLKLLIPGYQLTQLGQLAKWDALQLAYIPILQTIVLLAIGRWILSRQAL